MRFSKAVVKYRIPILILTVLLMIPAVIGIANTRINYDMLNYLPEDMDTIIGQNELMEDFGKGAFSFIIVEDMPNKDVAALKAKIEQVDHVDTVIWYDTLRILPWMRSGRSAPSAESSAMFPECLRWSPI